MHNNVPQVPATKSPVWPGSIFLLLQLTLVLGILRHASEGGQQGRPTLFQLCVFGLAGLALLGLRGNIAGPATKWTNRLLLLFLASVLLSWFFNFGASLEANVLLSDSNAGGSYFKVIVLAVFCIFACGTAYYLGWLMAGDLLMIRRLLWTIVGAASVNGIAVVGAWLIQTGGVLDRYNFILPIYNSYGLSATMSYTGLILVFPLWHVEKQGHRRPVLIAAAIVCLLSTIVIFSRQTTATLFGLLLLYGAISTRRSGLTLTKVLVTVALIIGLGLFFKETIGYASIVDWYYRLQDQSDSGILGRENAIYGSINIFLEHPVLGVGYGFWFAYNNATFAVVGAEAVMVASPHNGAAAVLSEGGVVGVLIFLALNLGIIWMLWRAKRSAVDRLSRELTNAIVALFILQSISQLIANSLLLPPSAEASSVQYAFIIWLLIGVSAGIESRGASQTAGSHTAMNRGQANRKTNLRGWGGGREVHGGRPIVRS